MMNLNFAMKMICSLDRAAALGGRRRAAAAGDLGGCSGRVVAVTFWVSIKHTGQPQQPKGFLLAEAILQNELRVSDRQDRKKKKKETCNNPAPLPSIPTIPSLSKERFVFR